MEIVPFIAESAADAARQVRERLGPQAVVVQVRPVDSGTRNWFGRKPRSRFEVLAYRPDPKPGAAPDPSPGPSPAPKPNPASSLSPIPNPNPSPGLSPGPGLVGGRNLGLSDHPGLSLAAGPEPLERLDLLAGDDLVEVPKPEKENSSPAETGAGRFRGAAVSNPAPGMDGGIRLDTTKARSGVATWQAGGILETAGFLPQEAQRVVDRLRKEHGDLPPVTIGDELVLVKRVLRESWKSARPEPPTGGETHVFVGAPGVGKTTCLCKWLTQVALGEGRPVRVWRLDGQTANTAEALAVYCDVLGVPVARRWCDGDGAEPGESGFVDLPGTDWRDATALGKLVEQVKALGGVRVHLVLNGAYDMLLMMRQVRAFEVLPVEDLIVTHLDEEGRWGKLWNLVLGTNYSVRFLGAGQNVPGEFQAATPDLLLMRQFPAG